MARLIHLNGPPGIGKSSLARRYLHDHPLTLVVEIDTLRTQLGRWESHDQTKTMARDIALAMIEVHLSAGHDVVLPQFLGRVEFVELLDETAARTGARFVEILLDAEPAVSADRFRLRRDQLLADGVPHPQAEVGDDEVDEIIAAAGHDLAHLARRRSSIRTVAASADIEATYVGLLRLLDEAT